MYTALVHMKLWFSGELWCDVLLFLGWGEGKKLCLSRGSGGDITFFLFSFIFVKQCKLFISFFLSLHPSLFDFFL